METGSPPGFPPGPSSWWAAKIDRNRERDAETLEKLAGLGWDVLVVWQCEMRDREALRHRLATFMEGRSA